jgi:hypothetical protein
MNWLNLYAKIQLRMPTLSESSTEKIGPTNFKPFPNKE